MPERSTPEVLGVDDFALRKGVKYGTILLNVERQCLVDLLPDREKATVATWLKSHPGVKMVSRDRVVRTQKRREKQLLMPSRSRIVSTFPKMQEKWSCASCVETMTESKR